MSESALDALMRNMGRAKESLDAIERAQEDHYGAEPEGVTWSHVGRVAHVADKLAEIVAFIEGKG